MRGFIKKLIATGASLSCMISAMPQVIFTSSADYTLYEAENATLTTATVKSDSDASGGKCAGNFSSSSHKVEFTVNVDKTGYYDITVCAKGIGSTKYNTLAANGENAGDFFSEKDEYSEDTVKSVYLNSGENTVTVTKNWGWIWLDYIKISESETIDESIYNVSKQLINPNATDSAKRLMSYLVDNYGKNVLTGQQADQGYSTGDVQDIEDLTGELPAVIGLDLMDYSLSSVTQHNAKGKSITRAIEVDEAGGIVTMCWHWRMYDEYLLSGTDNGNPRWWGAFYTKNIDSSKFNLADIMNNPSSEGYKKILADIDYAAEQLKTLQDANIPVLFRPLHEASGGWFWWGSDGAEPYKKLWKLMYDRMTNYHGLNNLIWVWNGQDANWYPGDEYCDIVSEDIYADAHDYSPKSSKFIDAVDYCTEKKIVTLSENGVLFDIDKAIAANTLWSWFCVWGGSYADVTGTYTEADMWKTVYQHENAITLDELPNLKEYPLPLELVQNTFTLDGKIGVNCDYKIPTEYVNGNYTINAVFTGDSETVTVPINKSNTVTVNEETAYRFTLPVAPCNMTETYSAQLVITDSDGNQVDQSAATDIYVNKYLKLYSMSSDTALKNLSSALRTYGYYSQKKFNTDATLPTTMPNNISDVNSATVKEYAQKTEAYDSDTKVTLGSPTLLVESETTIRFYISNLNGISADNLYLNYTVDGVTEKSKVQYSTEKEMYYADIPNIGAGKLSDMYTAYFTNGTAQVSDTVTYGACSYIFTTLKFSTDSTLKNLVRALYKYSVAADEYLG